MATVRAGVLYFATVFAAGFVLGIARILAVAPRVGEFAAVLIELPLILAISWFACGWILVRFLPAASGAARLGMGALAFVLLMGAEFGLAVAVFGRPAGEYVASFLTLSGALGLAGQIAFALIPLVRGRSTA